MSQQLLMTQRGAFVWLLHPREGMQRFEDIQPEQIPDGTTVKILGTAENARLICWLHRQQIPTQIGGPQLLTTTVSRTDARHTLLAMQDVVQRWIPAAMGGWHDLTELDAIIYGMVDVHPGRRYHLAEQHPVWRTCQQVSGLVLHRVAELMAEIRDPRWYQDPVYPDRSSRLRAYLGLAPQGTGRPDYMRRADLVRAVWHPGDVQPAATNFLWRYWHQRWNQRHDADYANLLTSQRFVAFLRYLWIAILQEPTTPQLFDPRSFFDERELPIFLQHLDRSRSCLWCIGS